MATRLRIYNSALRHIGSRELASLSENRESRRVLDGVWNDGFVRLVLEAGLWNFAIRTVQLEYTPDIEPEFGFNRAFEKPDDFVRTAAVCVDEDFALPLLAYADEAAYWFAHLDTLYIRYVSDGETYGSDLTTWPESFTQWVEALLASKVERRLTGGNSNVSTGESALFKLQEKLLVEAKSRDAMADPTAFPPQGSWVRSRSSRRGTRRDLGRRGQLIG